MSLDHINSITDRIKNVNNYVPTGTFVETLTYTIVNNEESDHKHIQQLCYGESGKENLYGFTNMKLIGNINKTKIIDLTIGGMLIDCIYPNINVDHRTFSICDNKILPFNQYNEIRLNIELLKEAELTITIDVYKLNNPVLNKDKHEILFTENKYKCVEYQDTKINKTKLDFSVLMKNITIFSLHPLADLKLVIDNRHTFTFNCETIKNEPSLNMFNMLADIPTELCSVIKSSLISSQFNKYVCYFDEPVEFSGNNDTAIYSTCDRETPNIIHVFCQLQNIFIIYKSRIGLAYLY